MAESLSIQEAAVLCYKLTGNSEEFWRKQATAITAANIWVRANPTAEASFAMMVIFMVGLMGGHLLFRLSWDGSKHPMVNNQQFQQTYQAQTSSLQP